MMTPAARSAKRKTPDGRWAYFGEFLLDVLAVFGIVAGGFLLAKLIEVLS